MAQETRKDPRAKVLTMTVRYKSATLDEFIEHHSHDVSRGGMFIKTPSPFPPGTLLKFEVKIADEQKVIQGVGRVVWKRESETSERERPNGMGVKFIKIDDASRKIIDQLISSRGDAGAAYEAGGGDGGSKTVPSATPAAAMTPALPEATTGKPAGMRKATMIGLGSMGAGPVKLSEPTPAPPLTKPASGGGFFPPSDSEADMPPPEDRTVMKQAAELLKDALREAGGSMDEVGTRPDIKRSDLVEPEKKAEPKVAAAAAKSESPATTEKGPHTLRSDAPKSEKKPETKPESKAEAKPEAKPASKPAVPARPAAAAAAAAATTAASARSTAAAARPTSTRPQPIVSESPAEGGGGRIMLILGGIAVAAAAVFFLTKQDPAPATPEPPAETTPAVTPPAPEAAAPLEAPSAAMPSEAPSAAAVPSAAPTPSAAAVPSVAATPSAALVPVAKPAPVAPTPKPQPAAARPKPKPAAPAAAEPGAEPAPPAPAAEPKPAEPAPAPAPKPKPAEPSGDNPY
jgi:uncharacterized protein (TIGR02266 family)